VNKHLIQSQKVLLTVASQQDWEKVQAEIGNFCKERLPDIFNSIFDEFAFNQTIRIDQLNIDLGNLSLDKLIQDIEEQVIIQIYAYFRNQNYHKESHIDVLDQEVHTFLKNLEHKENNIPKDKSVVFDHPEDANAYEVLAFYCQTGLKPWWLPNETTFKPAAVLVKLFNNSRQIFTQFIKVIKRNAISYKRLIQLVNRRLFFYDFNHFKTDILFLKYLEPNINIHLYDVILNIWFDCLEAEKKLIGIDDFGLWLFALAEENPIVKHELIASLELAVASAVLKNKDTTLIQRFNKLIAAIRKQEVTVSQKPKMKEKEEVINHKKPDGIANEASVLIENAGLILLYPYFKNLFSFLQLLNGNAFTNENAMHKAIVYLHYLVYNEMPDDECLLFFNKILCGADPETAINLNDIAFTAEELAEANDLKSTVIKHWSKLGSTTVQGLTDTFLKRNGSLILRAGDYHLYVEKKGFDVLLDTLPWPISIIRLPWNNYLINLNW
jgi:hypothetical protein